MKRTLFLLIMVLATLGLILTACGNTTTVKQADPETGLIVEAWGGPGSGHEGGTNLTITAAGGEELTNRADWVNWRYDVPEGEVEYVIIIEDFRGSLFELHLYETKAPQK